MGLRDHVPETPVVGLVVVLVALVCLAVVGALDVLSAAGVFELLARFFGLEIGGSRHRYLRAAALPYLVFGGLLALVGVGLLAWTLVATVGSVVDEREA